MNRRSFFASLAGLPLIRDLVPKPPMTATAFRVLHHNWLYPQKPPLIQLLDELKKNQNHQPQPRFPWWDDELTENRTRTTE